MAFTASLEDEDVDFLVFDHSQHVSHLRDMDLMCYETFYDSSPAKSESDLERSEMFQIYERNIYCSSVPDIDYMWPNTDGGAYDVLRLYDILLGRLFSDFSQEDVPTCLFRHGVDSPTVYTSQGLQQVPALVDNDTSGSVQPCLSPRTPQQARSEAKHADETSVITSTSPVHVAESDSQDSDTDARVPNSCARYFLPDGWYHIEE